MKSPKAMPKLDNIGMTASLLCAIHCAVVPILLTSLPLLGLGFLANPWFEWSMIIFALLIGCYAIGSSYVHIHHKLLPMGLLIAGFLIIIAGHLFISDWHEAIIVPVGGLLIATAHFFNFKYTGICREGSTLFHLKHVHAKNHIEV
jgi:phosphoglycerol transferase MdoB-like AlkP superfamily enzyme